MGLKVIEQNSSEILTIDECRKHLRIVPYGMDSTHPDDDLIMSIQASSREFCENFLGVSLISKTYELALDGFTTVDIQLPMPPTTEIISVKYLNSDNSEITLDDSNYVLDDYQQPGFLSLSQGNDWPATADVINSVKIRYKSGYFLSESEGAVSPFVARAAIMLMMGHLYANKEAITIGNSVEALPLGVEALLRPIRVRLGVA